MSDFFQLRLLLVDDDDFAQELLICSLTELGVDEGMISSCTSGRAALNIIAEPSSTDAYDLIICDLDMPDMDGLELLRRLAEIEYSGHIAVVSGLDPAVLRLTQDLADAHRLDVLDVLQKPISHSALAQLLESMIASQHKSKVRRENELCLKSHHILDALENDEFSIFYQPKILTSSQEVYGVEALLRWHSQEFQRFIGPDLFIPAAERFNLIDDLTQLVIRKSLPHAKGWKERELNLRTSINVSMQNLETLEFADSLARDLKHEGLEPEDIMVEITESSLMCNPVSVLEVLARLKMQRIDMSIDDFGTGYSSFSQLQKIPFAELKIDKTFVVGAGEDRSTFSLLESSASLARQMGIMSVAEGVETLDDWNRVAALGIDLVQGYLIAKPMPFEQVEQWVVDWAGLDKRDSHCQTHVVSANSLPVGARP